MSALDGNSPPAIDPQSGVPTRYHTWTPDLLGNWVGDANDPSFPGLRIDIDSDGNGEMDTWADIWHATDPANEIESIRTDIEGNPGIPKPVVYDRARQEVAKPYQLLPKRPNELWQTDVTYIRIPGYGGWYAITVIDYCSRYLLALHLTPSYSAVEASQALRQAVQEAERVYGPLTRPVFLVTNNGPSFIARRFQATLAGIELAGLGVTAFNQVRIAYRTPTQLGLLERFHETLKYEEVYWHLCDDPADARLNLAAYPERYNVARLHWALAAADPATAPARILTPCEVHVKGHAVNPSSWSRWVGWLDEQDQQQAAQPPNKTASRVSARNPRQDTDHRPGRTGFQRPTRGGRASRRAVARQTRREGIAHPRRRVAHGHLGRGCRKKSKFLARTRGVPENRDGSAWQADLGGRAARPAVGAQVSW